LALVDNALLGLVQFGGLSVDENALLLKYTYYGDIDLNGQVDADDLTVFANNFGRPAGATQIDGDIDFDGDVDADDLTVFANNFGKGIGAPSAANAPVPAEATQVAVRNSTWARAAATKPVPEWLANAHELDISQMSNGVHQQQSSFMPASRAILRIEESRPVDDDLLNLLAISITADNAASIVGIADARLPVGRKNAFDSFWAQSGEGIP
jgi:hypothetical protein